MHDRLMQLHQYRHLIQAGGGQKRIERQHETGKKTARERITALLDPDTFKEVDIFASSVEDLSNTDSPGEGVVAGHGSIDGRKVCVYAQDFTVTGGSLGRVHAAKICKVMDIAMKIGAPVIGMNDSGGAKIQEGVDALNGYGEIFFRNTIASGVIPQISIILGPCAGGAVYSPALTDFIFMVAGISQMFITGPQVIKAVTGEQVSMEKLGGAATHSKFSGVAHFINNSEDDCMLTVRALLGYLPSNNLSEAPVYAPAEPLSDKETLLDIIPADPNKSYDVRDVIQAVVDGSQFLEIQPYFAQNGVVGFARLAGHSVGVVANQPSVMAGSLDINVSDKIARFIRFCDAFNIPVITFMDVPGFLPGVDQEYGGVIRHGAKIIYAYAEATVPKVTVIVRKAYGGAYIAMCCSALRADEVFSWPSAEIAVMGPEGAVNILYGKEIAQAEDPVAMRTELVSEYRERFANPYIASAKGYVTDVIDPRDTREVLISALNDYSGKREARPRKKHGNMPC